MGLSRDSPRPDPATLRELHSSPLWEVRNRPARRRRNLVSELSYKHAAPVSSARSELEQHLLCPA